MEEKFETKIENAPKIKRAKDKINTYLIRLQQPPKAEDHANQEELEPIEPLLKQALEIQTIISRKDSSVIYHFTHFYKKECQEFLREIIEANKPDSIDQLIPLIAEKMDLLSSQKIAQKVFREYKLKEIVSLSSEQREIESDPRLHKLSDTKFRKLQNSIIFQILAKKDCCLLYHGTYPDRRLQFQNAGLSSNLLNSIMKSVFEHKPKNCYVILSSFYSHLGRSYDLNSPKLKTIRLRSVGAGRGEVEYLPHDLSDKFLSSYENFLKASKTAKKNLAIHQEKLGFSFWAIFLAHEFKFYYYNQDDPTSKLK